MRIREEVAVAAGGALGGLARYDLSRAIPHATLVVNVTGSFALGVLIVVVVRRRPADRLTRPFVATGFLGGYTTFSTFMVEALRHSPAPAVGYLALGLVTGLGAAWAGVATGRALTR